MATLNIPTCHVQTSDTATQRHSDSIYVFHFLLHNLLQRMVTDHAVIWAANFVFNVLY